MTIHESNPRRRRRPASAAVGGHHRSDLTRACRDCADMAVLTAITALAAVCVGAWRWESGAVLAIFTAACAAATVYAYLDEVRPALRQTRRSRWSVTHRQNPTPGGHATLALANGQIGP